MPDVVVLEGLSANFSRTIQSLADELASVLARPLKIPVYTPDQAQRRLEPVEVEELIAGYRGGASMKELAKKHGISCQTVARWLKLGAAAGRGDI